MAEATVDMHVISVPVDDGQITRALTDVDAKLAVWTEAMLDAQRLLASLTVRALAPATVAEDEPAGQAPATPELPTTASPGTQAEVPAETKSSPEGLSARKQAAVEPSANQPDVKSQPGESTVCRLASPEVVKPNVAPVKFTGTVNVEVKPPPPAPPPSEDEQLLASLDPETAKAIKVMRRLAPSKKSVKELLAEYQANKASAKAPAPERKSWFSRGR
ncbi:MAG TPA: hypothetical protein PKY77_14845 [Phycisphaerae bacterium]|nr:hypothetical protein [Phycisphaerae bacterium]HRY70576.1 hypothetical protein [Phycisphaerae bacterium]HSA28374.1 hypothetical protein [Phycisphaerae bacterium]